MHLVINACCWILLLLGIFGRTIYDEDEQLFLQSDESWGALLGKGIARIEWGDKRVKRDTTPKRLEGRTFTTTCEVKIASMRYENAYNVGCEDEDAIVKIHAFWGGQNITVCKTGTPRNYTAGFKGLGYFLRNDQEDWFELGLPYLESRRNCEIIKSNCSINSRWLTKVGVDKGIIIYDGYCFTYDNYDKVQNLKGFKKIEILPRFKKDTVKMMWENLNDVIPDLLRSYNISVHGLGKRAKRSNIDSFLKPWRGELDTRNFWKGSGCTKVFSACCTGYCEFIDFLMGAHNCDARNKYWPGWGGMIYTSWSIGMDVGDCGDEEICSVTFVTAINSIARKCGLLYVKKALDQEVLKLDKLIKKVQTSVSSNTLLITGIQSEILKINEKLLNITNLIDTIKTAKLKTDRDLELLNLQMLEIGVNVTRRIDVIEERQRQLKLWVKEGFEAVDVLIIDINRRLDIHDHYLKIDSRPKDHNKTKSLKELIHEIEHKTFNQTQNLTDRFFYFAFHFTKHLENTSKSFERKVDSLNQNVSVVNETLTEQIDEQIKANKNLSDEIDLKVKKDINTLKEDNRLLKKKMDGIHTSSKQGGGGSDSHSIGTSNLAFGLLGGGLSMTMIIVILIIVCCCCNSENVKQVPNWR